MEQFSRTCLEPHSAETAEKFWKAKMIKTYFICLQSLVAICRRTASRNGTVQSFLAIYLSVGLSRLDLNLNTGLRRAHCKGYIVAIYLWILMRFSSF